MRFWKQAVAAVAIVTLAGCAADDPNRRAKTGATVGALIGAVLGNQAKDQKKKRLLGAAVGAVAGYAVGSYMDKQQAELEQQLQAEQAADVLRIQRLGDDSLQVGVASEATFDVDRADLKAQSLNTFGKIAGVLKTYDKTVIHVVGHTDSTGSDQYNQGLSERRAASVSNYLIQAGVPADRVVAEGRGEREPRATNSTGEGRRMNRRVDIVIKPIVEGQEDRAFDPPPRLTT